MFTKEDLKQLKSKGITEKLATSQIENFVKGFPYIHLQAPATPGDGIIRMDPDQLKEYSGLFEKESSGIAVLKFVPASGAATRMFKDLFTWHDQLESGISPEKLIHENEEANTFFTQIRKFAFWKSIVEIMKRKGLDAEACVVKKDYLPLLKNLLDDDGLGYAMLPKGLLQFHNYDGFTRTAAEEHLMEGVYYARDGKGRVKLHFTVSPEHRGRFINHLSSVMERYEKEFGVKFEIKFSIQKPSTDTLAVSPDNKPFRNNDGSLLFRPGGHGALIQNLNELKQDVVFIKNIDNVVPDSLKEETILYKKAIGGLLISIQNRIHHILKSIEYNTFTSYDYSESRLFLTKQLHMGSDNLPDNLEEGKKALTQILSRPIRVCGMVQNAGEPGGGPFWVKGQDGSGVSLQIVESSQVDHHNPEQKSIFEKSTHFNPVDLVCGLKNHKGEAYDLTDFVDHSTGFISLKSKDGKDLKAQELPGLWNGSMAGWISLFVEVPLATFNPVKTVMDLLRKEHQ